MCKSKTAIRITMVPILVILAVCAVACKDSEPTDSEVEWAYVDVQSSLRMRAAPSTESAMVGNLAPGTKVRIISRSAETVSISGITGQWTEIRADDQSGWVFGGFLSSRPPSSSQTSTLSMRETVAAIRDIHLMRTNGVGLCVANGAGIPLEERTWTTGTEGGCSLQNAQYQADSVQLTGRTNSEALGSDSWVCTIDRATAERHYSTNPETVLSITCQTL